jgi:hypothetical protein
VFTVGKEASSSAGEGEKPVHCQGEEKSALSLDAILRGKSLNSSRNGMISSNISQVFDYKTEWRRERDSNPRYLAVKRFSRPPVSTTHTSLRGKAGAFRLKVSRKSGIAAILA